MSIIMVVMILLPVIASVPAFVYGAKSLKTGTCILSAVSAVEFICSVVLLFNPFSAAASGICAHAISLSSGGFHSLMVFVTALGWLAASAASYEYFTVDSFRSSRWFGFALFVLGATMGVFLSDNLITLFIFFEMMSLSSWVWVANSETDFTRKASETYLYVGIIGGLTMLSGIILLYVFSGSFDYYVLSSAEIPYGIKLAAGLLMLAGFGAKAGMFPLHIWLPRSYPAAPTPATALLSGVLSKTGVYGVVVLSCFLFAGDAKWGDTVLVLAVLTMFIGALLALFSTDLKRTLACSSMSQIGFILTGAAMCSLLGEHGSLAASGTILHVLNHSLIKLTLFTACAVMFINVGSTKLADVRGFGKGKPLLLVCFLACAASVAGIPGFSGYISKTLLHESIVEYGEIAANPGYYKFIEAIFLCSGGLTLAYMSRLFYIVFLSGEKKESGRYMGAPISAVLIVGAVSMLALGLTATKSMDGIAAACVGFFNVHPMKGVHYFSLENLKGAAISITVGALVFFLIGMKCLTKKDGFDETYLDAWPKWLDMDNYFYRPLLRAFAFVGAIFARTVETVGATIVYLPINIIFYDAKTKWLPGKDKDFGTYVQERERSIVQKTFSSDLLCAAIGIVVFVILILVKTL